MRLHQGLARTNPSSFSATLVRKIADQLPALDKAVQELQAELDALSKDGPPDAAKMN